MYGFLLWLVPTVEKFPRRQKFLLGDRMQATALDVLERLVEAAYTRERRGHLNMANLGIEKLRQVTWYESFTSIARLTLPGREAASMTFRVAPVTFRSCAWMLRRGEAVMPIEASIQVGIADMPAVEVACALAVALPWGVYGDTVIPSDILPTGTTTGHPAGTVFVETAREQPAAGYV